MDIRAWATGGMFALVFYVMSLIAFVPEVSDSELFKTATLLLGSGAFGLVCVLVGRVQGHYGRDQHRQRDG